MSSQPHIYTSPHPPVTLAEESVFSYIFPEQPKFPEESLAFIDAVSGRSFTRGQLRDNALRLGWGLKNKLGLKRGDTVMVFR